MKVGNGGNGRGEAIGLRSGKKSVYVSESENEGMSRTVTTQEGRRIKGEEKKGES